MAEGRGEEAWQHTSALLATLININRDPKKGRPVKLDAFNPYSRRQAKVPASKANVRLLREVFVGNDRKGRKE